MLRKIRLGSWIALGVFIFMPQWWGRAVVDRIHCPTIRAECSWETFGYVLSSRSCYWDLAIDPEGTIG